MIVPVVRNLGSRIAVVLMFTAGCSKGESATDGGPTPATKPASVEATLPAWGAPLAPAHGPEALARAKVEAGRDPATLLGTLGSQGPIDSQTVWGLARIGGRAANVALGKGLALIQDQDVAALALLDAPGPDRDDEGARPAPWAALEKGIWTRYALTEDKTTRAGLLLAAARIGGQASVQAVTAELEAVADAPDEFGDLSRTLGLLCVRKYALTERARDALLVALRHVNPETQAGALYALGRCGAVSAEVFADAAREPAVARITEIVHQSKSDDHLRLAWRAFAGLGEAPKEVPAGVLGESGGAWAVDVEAVRALVAQDHGRKTLATRLAKASLPTGPRWHVWHEALRRLRPHIASDAGLLETLAPLEARLKDTTDRGGVTARCEYATLQGIAKANPDAPTGCTGTADLMPPGYEASLRVEVATYLRGGKLDAKRRATLLDAADSAVPRVSEAAMAALTELEGTEVESKLLAGLRDADVGIASAAASALASRALRKATVPQVEGFVWLLEMRTEPAWIEARIESLRGLARAAGEGPDRSERTAPAKPSAVQTAARAAVHGLIGSLAADPAYAMRHAAREVLSGPLWTPAWAEHSGDEGPPIGAFDDQLVAKLETLRDVAGLVFETSAGSFEVRFDGAPAPLAQANLVALAQAGYFNGLAFHRVVPGFVIQGGDPRGDGYGGPGYAVPCEWSPVRYQRGTMGIALAGKDTGGSQIFVTQFPQPHLDGRYPVVGQVVAGMDVVDAILPFDRIVAVRPVMR